MCLAWLRSENQLANAPNSRMLPEPQASPQWISKSHSGTSTIRCKLCVSLITQIFMSVVTVTLRIVSVDREIVKDLRFYTIDGLETTGDKCFVAKVNLSDQIR